MNNHAEDAPCLLSLVVPLHNHVALSQAMLASLEATLPEQLTCEILLVDDASRDETPTWLASLQGRAGIRVFTNSANAGFAATCNRGAREARGEFLGFLNNDLVMEPGWLEPMLSLLRDEKREVGIVGNLQYRADDGRLDHAGIHLTPRAKLEHLRQEKPSEDRRVLAVTAACCLVRRDDFLSLGGFDEAYRNGGEDVDLCLGLAAKGRECWVAARSQVRHHVSATRGPSSLNNETNSRRLFLKWKSTLERELSAELLRLGEASEETAPLLAKSALWREEARWRTLLDGEKEAPSTLQAEGLVWSASGSPPYLRHRAQLRLSAGKPVRELILSGHLAEMNSGEPLGLIVTINGIQTHSWYPLAPGGFDLAIPDPAALPDRATEIRLDFVGPRWSRLRLLTARLLSALPLPQSLGKSVDTWAHDREHKRLRLEAITADGTRLPFRSA